MEVFSIVTVTFGRGAPDASLSVPLKVLPVTCARRYDMSAAHKPIKNSSDNTILRIVVARISSRSFQASRVPRGVASALFCDI